MAKAKPTTPDPFETKREPGEPPPEVKRDQWGRYILPNPDTGKLQSWTRATTFANTAADQYNIGLYNERLVVKGMAMRPDLFAEAASAHIDDKKTLQRIAELAKEAAGASAKARLGTALHTFTEKTDKNEKVTVPAPWDKDVAAYVTKLKDEKIEVVPEYIEATIIVPSLNVAGTLDRLIRVIGWDGLIVGDLKTGHSVQYAWMEIACQLYLYSRATHIYDHRTETLSEMPKVNQDKAMVIHLPVGDAECELYEINLELGSRVAAVAEVVRELRKRKDFSIPWEGSVSRAVAMTSDEWGDAGTSASGPGSDEEVVSDDADWEDVKAVSDQQAPQAGDDAKADDEWENGPSAEETMAQMAAEDEAKADDDDWDEGSTTEAVVQSAIASMGVILPERWVSAGIDPSGKRWQRTKLADKLYIVVDVQTGKHEEFKLLRDAKARVTELEDTLVTPDADVRPIGAAELAVSPSGDWDEPADPSGDVPDTRDEWDEQEGALQPAQSADEIQRQQDEIAQLKAELARIRSEGEETPIAAKRPRAVPGVRPKAESKSEPQVAPAESSAEPVKRKWMAEVLGAESVGRLGELYHEAKDLDEWTDRLTKAAATRKAEILAAEAAEVDDDDNW
jgi:hypothetical protein